MSAIDIDMSVPAEAPRETEINAEDGNGMQPSGDSGYTQSQYLNRLYRNSALRRGSAPSKLQSLLMPLEHDDEGH